MKKKTRNVLFNVNHGQRQVSPTSRVTSLKSAFVSIRLAIVLSVLQIKASDFLFDIFNFFSPPLVFGWVHIAQSVVFCVLFSGPSFVFSYFVYDNFIVCLSSIYGFWLPLCYLQMFSY